MPSERLERFFDDWDGWSLLLMAGGAMLCLVVLIPAIDIGLGDERARFFVLMLALAAIMAACVQLALPKKNYEDVHMDMTPMPARAIKDDLDDIGDQVELYRELQSVFARRVRVRRGISEAEWTSLGRDGMERLLEDRDLVRLVTGQIVSDGNAVGEGFKDHFERLMRKVEEWR